MKSLAKYSTFLLIAVLLSLTATACASQDDSKARKAAYYEKCQEYLALYGSPSATQASYTSYANGLSYVGLVDMNGDGKDELVVAYLTSDDPLKGIYACGVEVWRYANNELVCDYEGSTAQHGTNGFFPYIEISPKADGKGSVFVIRGCHGSAPVLETFDVCGYKEDGSFGPLVGRAVNQFEKSYFIAESGTGNTWEPAKWQKITADEYESAFSILSADQSIHLHLYSMLNNDFDQATATMSEMISQTRSTIDSLAPSSK